jgi:hypothetical protein
VLAGRQVQLLLPLLLLLVLWVRLVRLLMLRGVDRCHRNRSRRAHRGRSDRQRGIPSPSTAARWNVFRHKVRDLTAHAPPLLLRHLLSQLLRVRQLVGPRVRRPQRAPVLLLPHLLALRVGAGAKWAVRCCLRRRGGSRQRRPPATQRCGLLCC